MTNRACGTCTACCEGWLTSDELDMRPGRPCRHCTGQGCAIYENRPEDPCIRFQCAWLQEGSPLPEAMRPDRSGVIVLSDRTWQDWKVIYAIPAGERVPADSLEWLRNYARDAAIPLIFHERLVVDGEFTGVRKLAFGSQKFAEAVKYAIGPEDIVKM
jgi:hypothetical protein